LIEILEGVKEGEEVIERGDAVPVGAKVSIREVKEASIKEGAYMIAP
jgi:hypothetical protein